MIKFGTGGWRAEIGKDFNADNIQKVAQALCVYIKGKGKDERMGKESGESRLLSR